MNVTKDELLQFFLQGAFCLQIGFFPSSLQLDTSQEGLKRSSHLSDLLALSL